METRNQKKGRGEMLTTTISLTQDMHRRLKHLAVDQGVSVRDLIREAIEEYLNRKEKEKSSVGSLQDAEKLRTPSF
jgi:predicted transcriptional regulator